MPDSLKPTTLKATPITPVGGVSASGKVTIGNPLTGSPTNQVPWSASTDVDKVNVPDGTAVDLWVAVRTTSTSPGNFVKVTSFPVTKQKGTGSGTFLSGNVAPASAEVRLSNGTVVLRATANKPITGA
jgi:hypothetical protein